MAPAQRQPDGGGELLVLLPALLDARDQRGHQPLQAAVGIVAVVCRVTLFVKPVRRTSKHEHSHDNTYYKRQHTKNPHRELQSRKLSSSDICLARASAGCTGLGSTPRARARSVFACCFVDSGLRDGVGWVGWIAYAIYNYTM